MNLPSAAAPQPAELAVSSRGCINCARCIDVCPRGLVPDQLFKLAQGAAWSAAAELGLQTCIECGLCDRVCPSNINLAEIFTQAKRIEAYQRQDRDHRVAIKQRYVDHQERSLQRSQSTASRPATATASKAGLNSTRTKQQSQAGEKMAATAHPRSCIPFWRHSSRADRSGLLPRLGVLLNGIVFSIFCALIEVGIVLLQRPAQLPENLRHLGDGSTLLTAWLIAVCLPPDLPISVLAVAALAAIGLAKHAYGGLGQNVFNPAMVGYAVILLSFPALLASYPNIGVDSLSGATLLSDFVIAAAHTWLSSCPALPLPGKPLSRPAFFCGGLWLLFRRIISWRIPTAVLLTVGVLAAATYDQGSSQSLGSPWFHWTAGGTAAAAFSLPLTRLRTLQTLDIKFYLAV